MTQDDDTPMKLWDRALELTLRAQSDLAAAVQAENPRLCLSQVQLRASALNNVVAKLLKQLDEGRRL